MLFLASTDCLEWPIVGGPFHRNGWFFHVDEDFYVDPEEKFSDLSVAIRYAANHRFSHILFDYAGGVCDDLPQYRDPDREFVDAMLYAGPARRAARCGDLPSSITSDASREGSDTEKVIAALDEILGATKRFLSMDHTHLIRDDAEQSQARLPRSASSTLPRVGGEREAE